MVDEKQRFIFIVMPDGMNAIRNNDLHKAKGLQFPVVILLFL